MNIKEQVLPDQYPQGSSFQAVKHPVQEEFNTLLLLLWDPAHTDASKMDNIFNSSDGSEESSARGIQYTPAPLVASIPW